ncbi:MAG TPA: CAP domain-containing protein [bacterium]|nr:CAP domain-containing protein [bacterium]
MKIKIKDFFWPHPANNYRPHAVRHKNLFYYSVFLIAVKAIIFILLFFSYPNPAEFSTITANRIIELTNKERQNNNLSLLKHNSTLDLAAQKKINDMLKNNYFAHTSPAGIKPWQWFKEADYNYTFAGENLAMNFIEAEDVVTAWMDSPTHRDNIVSPNYEDIGIAVAVGQINGQETTLVVQLFGKSYAQVAGESFAPTSPPIESEKVTGPLNIMERAAEQEVRLEKKHHSGLVAQIVYYGEKIFLVFLGFIILNLILTIMVRIEVQHRPVILHCLFVILLTLSMIMIKFHFIENLTQAISII